MSPVFSSANQVLAEDACGYPSMPARIMKRRFNTQTPSNHRLFNTQRQVTSGRNMLLTAEFYPAVPFLVGAEFNAGLGEREIVGFEADFDLPSNFHRELA